MSLSQYRVFYTSTRKDGSRLEGEIIVEATGIEDSKKVAQFFLRLQGTEARNFQSIDNS